MAQLKSTVVQGNLAVTENVSIGENITILGDTNANNIYASNMIRVGSTSGQLVEIKKNGIYYEIDGSNNYGTLSFPDNKNGTLLVDADIDDALSSTSENPVQNKVINTALNGKLTANGWSTNSSGGLVYGLHDSTQIQIRREYISLMDDGPRTTTILRFPTGNKDSTIATIEDIQSYIDTAILGGSW